MAKVAFVGLGVMGYPMAGHLKAKGGHEVMVYNRTAAKAEKWVSQYGGKSAPTPRQAADGQDFVLACVGNDNDLREVMLGKDGVFAGVGKGAIVVDHTTASAEIARELYGDAKKRSFQFIDAPVSGGVPRAVQGTLTIMVGGDDPAAIDRARPLLRAMGDRLFDTGGLGSGHAMKALNNFVAAAGFAACAEALLAGQRFGLDPARMIEILNVSTGRSFHTDLVLREHVVGGKFATGFQLGLLAKDVRIAADLAHDLQLDAPLVRLVSERFETARDMLGFTRDHTEAIKAWDKNSAV